MQLCLKIFQTYNVILNEKKKPYSVTNASKMDVKIVNDVIKSPEDKRLYRGLILPNGLHVLLISDHKTDKSGASVNVAVGSLSDPDELPGLAHFLEHMLFMGSEKYPGEDKYRKYITEHGGSHNALTANDQTLYYFEVASDYLEGSLNRLAQFFLCPLMTENAVEREVNAVSSEHENKISQDCVRMYRMEKWTSKKNHPYNKFSTGNKKTLVTVPQEKGIDVRKELLKFHEKWYSANIMTLIVVGKESLDELEEMTVPLFSQVKNKNVKRPEWTDHPFGPDQTGTLTKVVPIRDIRMLKISFPTPALCKYYKAKPFEYFEYLLNNKDPGSLLSFLKAKNWANTLFAFSQEPAKGFGTFNIIMHGLTVQGIKKIDEIIELTFQYLNMLREGPPQKWIFEEYKKIFEIDFRFKGKRDPHYYAMGLSIGFHRYEYPLKEILSGYYLIEEWRPDLISKILSDYLKPSNVKVAVFAQEFDAVAEEEEPWYGIKYKIEKIPNDVLEKWENCGTIKDFKLPPVNEFIPSNFDVCFNANDKNRPRHPLIIHESDFSRVWYKQDDEFLLPKACLRFHFRSPSVYMDPMNCNLSQIFAEQLRGTLTEYTDSASAAGFQYHIHVSYYGLTVFVDGYDDKINVLTDKIFDKMTNLKIGPKKFKNLKEKRIKDLKNFEAHEPYYRIDTYLLDLLQEKTWTTEELLKAASEVTLKNLKLFMRQFFSKLHIESLIHGNINKERADELIQILEDRFVSKLNRPLSPSEFLCYREVQLNNGEYLVREITDKLHKCSSIGIYYQCGALSTENNVLMDLLIQIMKEPCFDILRTKEQLGYIVRSESWDSSNSVTGLIIIVQSDKHPNFLDERIENFLIKMRDIIENLTEDEFERNKQALTSKRLEKPKNLEKLTQKFFEEVYSRQYNFNKDEIEVNHLQTIGKNDLIEFFDEYIRFGAPKRRKLSVHVISQAEGGAGKWPEDLKAPTRINDVIQFKRSHGLLPLTEPFADNAVFKAMKTKEVDGKS